MRIFSTFLCHVPRFSFSFSRFFTDFFQMTKRKNFARNTYFPLKITQRLPGKAIVIVYFISSAFLKVKISN